MAAEVWWPCLPGTPAYPILLATVGKPPSLAVRGSLRAAEQMVAIVGARRMSAYGEEIAYEVARGLSAAGITVVSGLARGIDAAAHRGALDGGGRTVAVMGTGPDQVYPPEHRGLAERIAGSGALVTQFPEGTEPYPRNFPARNATISGLSVGVVVVEARRRSGAMLTAGAAGDQNRVVMAVPGSIHNPGSRGCHDLIRDGAVLVTSARDVLELVGGEPLLSMVVPGVDMPGPGRFGDIRDAVVAVLASGGRTLDGVVEALGGEATEAVAAVARLRLDGVVVLRDGAYGLRSAFAPGE